MDRSKLIIKASYQGILMNTLLTIFKALVGFMSGSIAIILDAVNNLTDAVSSIITIIGTKLSNKPADKEHPYGHGRIEYITSVIISLLILFTAFMAFQESFEKVLHPVHTTYTWATFLVLIIAILVKFFFGMYLKRTGNKLNAQALIGSGLDAILDSFVSLTTLISALIFIVFHINLDGILGILISLLILKTGYDLLKEALGSLIGNRVDSKIAIDLQDTIGHFPHVEDVYDLILHDYGPDEMIGSVHIEVNDKMTAKEIDGLTRDITALIFKKYGILLTIGICATNVSTKELYDIKKETRHYVESLPYVLQMHGFFYNENENSISFDLVLDFKDPNPTETIEEIKKELIKRYPKYSFIIHTDTDYADLND